MLGAGPRPSWPTPPTPGRPPPRAPPRAEPETAAFPGGTGPHDRPEQPPGGETAQAFGDYEVLGEVGRGGMGVVYRARERHSGRLVALKMMLGRPDGATSLRRFLLEARATGELSHPGVVAIHTWGEHQGAPFYTMDFVPGRPLSQLLGKGPLPPGRAVRYLAGIARAVAAAHALGIVHRDLKPGNVIIDPGDQPRVLDFGLAKRHRTDPGTAEGAEPVLDALPLGAPVPAAQPARLTEKGAILGTPSYMAPEQARGQHDRVGPPADVHALGAIFYEMLTGRPPYQGDSAYETLLQVQDRRPTPVRALNPRVPAALEAVCRRCLEKEPRARYADAGDLAEDLETRWQQLTQGRRFARLTLAAGLVVLLLEAARLLLAGGLGLDADRLAGLAEGLAAGPPLRATAGVLARLVWGAALVAAPLVAGLGVLVWLGAWVWHAGRPWLLAAAWTGGAAAVLAGWAWAGTALGATVPLVFPLLVAASALVPVPVALYRRWAPHQPAEAGKGPGTEPFLQRLFAARVETGPKPVVRARTGSRAEAVDYEPGKVLHRWGGGVVRWARQKSLDRPVLVWLDTAPAPPGAVLPGVAVRDPNVLALYAVGSGAEGRYLVTEPVPAVSLAQLLERRKLEPEEAVRLAIRLADALQGFHDQGACHGRLGSDWILVRGDLDPLLCPCGVPLQSPAARAEDLAALGRLLQGWLAPRPRFWQWHPRAAVYRVCDAVAAGAYERAADLAADLGRAAGAARLRRRHRWANALVVVLLAVPLVGLAAEALRGGGLDRQTAATCLLLAVGPAALLLGYVHGRVLVHRRRLRGRAGDRRGVLGSTAPGVLLPAALVLAPAALLGVVSAGPLLGGLPAVIAVLAALSFLGAYAAGLVTFGESLLHTLQLGPPREPALPPPEPDDPPAADGQDTSPA